MKTFAKGLLLAILPLVIFSQKIIAAPAVVINEIAWSGTATSTADEWIELYNITNNPIDLTGWQLISSDGTPEATLSGGIPANGYFLLERTDDTTISDVTADATYSGALNDTGETLTLKDDTGDIIDTANVNGDTWPGGTGGTGTPPRASMERVNPLLPDTDDNWATNSGIIKNGLDANGNLINGTPKSQNSVYVVPTPTPTETPSPTLTPTLTPIATPTLAPTETPMITVTPTTSVVPTPTITPKPRPFKNWWLNFWRELSQIFPIFPL